MSGQTVEIDGIQYYTLLEKPPISSDKTSSSSPPILLCHALMANLHMWDSTVLALNTAGYTTLRFDHVGHNKTPPPPFQDPNRAFHMDTITQHMHQLVLFCNRPNDNYSCSRL
ncbi:Putative alpha/beta hydrolase-1 [Septoria linicola]|uniref:Alpha/beta hydrolase-1 n=1 Tax=Septoria linicola TaxID=215465 RepID=A0A9Q9AQJ5_9PEZI|nr:putative alpha/beta hydrolase-1 [Septoria linicola]USW53887.1 Putative alpha/beta hydrolase-1 [Septoria linicola]